ncbi:hypothetical protein HK104_000208, partial [Borealophlyctis nickersoniae]
IAPHLRLLIANHSDFFQAAIDVNLRESLHGRLELRFPDPRGVLPSIFEYFYTGDIKITPRTAIATLCAAEQLQASELIHLCRSYTQGLLTAASAACTVRGTSPTPGGGGVLGDTAEGNVQVGCAALATVVDLLKDAVEFHASEWVDIAIEILSTNFDLLPLDRRDGAGVDLSFLPYDLFLSVVGHPSLALDEEMQLYRTIEKYVRYHHLDAHRWLNLGPPPTLGVAHVRRRRPAEGPETEGLNEKQVFELFSKVSYEKLTLEQVEEVLAESLVPREFLCRGLLLGLKMAKGIPVQQPLERQIHHRQTRYGRDFVYSHDFDTHGVIYYLGTQNATSPFTNPHEMGVVTCTMSSTLIGSPATLTSRRRVPTCTRREKEPFLMIDLGPSMALRVTRYTLRHGAASDKVNLRRFVFQGSDDGENWHTLTEHKGGGALGGCFGSWSWDVPDDESSARHWRYLRIKGIGTWFIQVSGWEFYGNLRSDYWP